MLLQVFLLLKGFFVFVDLILLLLPKNIVILFDFKSMISVPGTVPLLLLPIPVPASSPGRCNTRHTIQIILT